MIGKNDQESVRPLTADLLPQLALARRKHSWAMAAASRGQDPFGILQPERSGPSRGPPG